MRVVDINKYRLAKKYSEDSVNILKVVTLSLKALKPYKHYRPVLDIVNQLDESQLELQAHLNKAKKIIEEGKNEK